MECDHAPRHHGLRTGHGRSSFPSRSSHTDKQRHAQSNQKHEQERNAGSGHPLPARFDMPGFHHHTQYESGKQHLDMNTALLAEIIFGKQVNQLGNTENHDRIGQNRPPILPQLVLSFFHPSHNSRKTITTTTKSCQRRPIIRICRGIISRMVSRSSKIAST